MDSEKYELEPMASASLDVQFSWTMGIMAKKLKIRKRDLKEAKKILDKEEFTDEILEKGRFVELTFTYGFRTFVKKTKRKRRKILAPHPKIQEVLKAVKHTLVKLVRPHENAYGFVKKRNVQMAVDTLLGNTHFMSFDIADAFPSITEEMVEKAFTDLDIEEELVLPLTWLVTYYYKGKRRLPQGASDSPAILNLVYLPMCYEIDEYCRERGIKWFVYADDFNFGALEIDSKAKKELMAIPPKYGFALKDKKTRDNLGKTIPHLLGLTIVDGKRHISRYTKKKFRRMLYMACKHGAYSKEQVAGVSSAIKQTYGEVENWPGWLREYYAKYEVKRKEEERRKRCN